MTDAEWPAATHSAEMLRAARGRVSLRKLRLLAVACCRRLWDDLDPRARRELTAAESFADGQLGERDFLAAFPAGVPRADVRTVRGSARWAAYLLGWPTHPEMTSWDIRADPPRQWSLAEYWEKYADRVIDAVANALAVRDLGGGQALYAEPDAPDPRREGYRTDPYHAGLVRCVVPNPAHPAVFDPGWRTEPVVALARRMYDARDFSPAPVLADALDDAGCADAELLAHLRGPGPHARGCRAVDLVLGLD